MWSYEMRQGASTKILTMLSEHLRDKVVNKGSFIKTLLYTHWNQCFDYPNDQCKNVKTHMGVSNLLLPSPSTQTMEYILIQQPTPTWFNCWPLTPGYRKSLRLRNINQLFMTYFTNSLYKTIKHLLLFLSSYIDFTLRNAKFWHHNSKIQGLNPLPLFPNHTFSHFAYIFLTHHCSL